MPCTELSLPFLLPIVLGRSHAIPSASRREQVWIRNNSFLQRRNGVKVRREMEQMQECRECDDKVSNDVREDADR